MMVIDVPVLAMTAEPVRIAQHGVERCLRVWVSYMHGDEKPEGLPAKACGGVTNYTSMDLDNIAAYENLDTAIAEHTNAVIESLPPAQKCAVHHIYLHAFFRFPRDNVHELLENAKHALEIGLRRRGVWLGE
jgi:hypothetical protein